MFKNHLKVSLRNLWKNRTLSVLNLLGLSIGIGSVLTLLFSVYAYYIADSNLEGQEQIYSFKTIRNDGVNYFDQPFPLMDKILETSPQTVAGTHMHGWGNIWLEYKEKELQERTDYVDPEFFDVFSLPLKYGDKKTALKNTYSVILTDRVSQKIFGDKNPVGETLKGADSLNLTVTGVFEPISPYSSFRFGVVLPNEILKNNPSFKSQNNWSNSFTGSFIRVRHGTDIAQLERLVNKLVQQNYTDPTLIKELKAIPHSELRMEAIPVVRIIINGSIAASFFVLLIVLVNLLNLNASTLFMRTKDIAVRKILGGSKHSVIVQYCMENGILVFIAVLISGGLFLGLLLPTLNDIYGADFGKIDFTVEKDYPVIIGAILLGLVVTLIVGVFPALRFISVPVAMGIKGKIEAIKSNFFFRNSFIIMQFAIAILFICIAVILNHQIGFMKSADVGFERDQVIVGNIDLDYKDLEVATSKFNTLLDALKANPYVKSLSVSEAIPSDYYFNYTDFYDTYTGRDVHMRRSHTDDGYLKTLQVPMVMGRDFNKDLDNSEETSAIINRSAMKALGWNTIEGKYLKYKNYKGKGYRVVGVMEDFHYQDFQNAVEPLFHIYNDQRNLGSQRYLSVRVEKGGEKPVQQMIASAFDGIDSRRNYGQAMLTEKVNGQYRLIEGMLKTVNVVALLTIFIACLGMFGLISFVAKRRVKEIGIHKVLGAGVAKIVVLLSKDFMVLVGVSALIAFPIAYYVMNAWLNGFAYSIKIQWWMFALSGSIAFLITSLILSIQAVKSALANPVKSLRTE